MPKNKDNEKVNSRKGLLKRARGVWKGVKRIINRSQNRENERTPVMTSEKESRNSPYLSLDMPNPNLFEDVNDFYNTRPTIDSLRNDIHNAINNPTTTTKYVSEEFKDEEVTNVGEVKEAHISQNLSDSKEELLEVCKNLKNHLESNQKALEHREKKAYTDEDKEKINTLIKDNESNISKINDFIDSITNGTDSFDASEIKFQTQVLTAWENRTLKQQDIFIEDFFLKAETPHFSLNSKLPNTNLFEDVNDFYNKIDNEANMAQVDSRIQYSKSRIEGINSYLDENKNAIGYKNYKNELNQVATKLENLEDNWNRESDTSVFYTNYVELNNSINELTQKVFPNISVEDFNEINDMAVELTDITKKVMDEYKQGRRRIIQLKAILTREAGEHFFLGDFEEKTREYDKEIKNLRTIRNNAQNIHREYSQYEDVDASSGISNQIIEPFIYIGEDTKNLLNNKLRTINEEYTNIVEKCNNDLHNIIYKGTSCRNMPKTQRDNIYNALKINKDGVEFKTKEQKVKFNDDLKIDYFEKYDVDKEKVTNGGIEVELDETAQILRYHNQKDFSELGNEERRSIRQKWRNPEPVLDKPQLAENENEQEIDDEDIPLFVLQKNKLAAKEENQQATDQEAPIEMSEQDFDDIKNMSYEVKAKAKDRIMAYKEARDIVEEFDEVLEANKINYDAEEAKAVIESYIENIRNLRDIRDNAEAIYDECNEYITINTFSTMPGNDTNRETFEYINGNTIKKLKDDYGKLSEHKDISYIIEETANDLGNICFTDTTLPPQHVSIINTAMIQITERLDLLKRQRLVISDCREKSKEQIVDWNNEYVAKETKVKFKQENDYKLYTEADNLPEEEENEDYTKEMEQEDNPKAVEQEEDSEEVEQDKETIIGTFYNTVGFSYIGDQLRRHGYESNRVAVTNPFARDNDRLNAAKRIQESIGINRFNDLTKEIYETRKASADIGDAIIHTQLGIREKQGILKVDNLSESEMNKLNYARGEIYLKSGDTQHKKIHDNNPTETPNTYRYVYHI